MVVVILGHIVRRFLYGVQRVGHGNARTGKLYHGDIVEAVSAADDILPPDAQKPQKPFQTVTLVHALGNDLQETGLGTENFRFLIVFFPENRFQPGDMSGLAREQTSVYRVLPIGSEILVIFNGLAPMDEVKVPREITGSAMSIGSFVGYLPGAFMYLSTVGFWIGSPALPAIGLSSSSWRALRFLAAC